jgi:hypothetical protein
LSSVFTGQISFKECLAFFDNHRNGQAFFVPVMMAAFQAVGLSIKGSYLATNGVFLAAAAALLLGLLRVHGITGDRSVIAAGLLLFSHRCFIGAVGELQTDLGGVVATMLFVYALLRAFATEDARVRLGWYIVCGVVGFLGCTIRTALLSLPLVPACLFVWSLFCERQRTRQERLSYLIPSVTGVTLLWACWLSLGLWGTLHLAWADGKRVSPAFPWKVFMINTLLGMQFGVAVIFVLWRRLFDDRGFAVVVGSAFSLLALLACSPEVPWFRYWDSAAVLGVIVCIWILKEWPARDRALLGVAWMSASLNLLIK